ncbi:MAG: hypothetical protein WA949_11630 [Phormidesmis sp.]
MMVNVQPDDQRALLSVLADNPPITLLFSGTDDQRREIKRQKCRVLCLREKLAAYFNGQPDFSIEGLNEFDQEGLELEKDKVLAFYSLIQGSWVELVSSLDAAGVSLSDSGIYQPGEFIAAYIANKEARYTSNILSSFYRWTPSAVRKQIKLLRDAQKLIAEKPYEKMKRPERKLIDKATTEAERLTAQDQTGVLMAFMLDRCQHLAAGSGQYSPIKRRLEAYNTISAKSFAHMTGAMHPRKRIKGWEMVKGRKKVMSAHGGVASA